MIRTKNANKLFTKNTRGMTFTIPKDVAIVVGQTLFGTREVPNNINTIDLQRKLDHAYNTRIFAWRIRVKGEIENNDYCPDCNVYCIKRYIDGRCE